jgi:hypothetical protein
MNDDDEANIHILQSFCSHTVVVDVISILEFE